MDNEQEEIKSTEAFTEYWKRKLVTVEGYFPNRDYDQEMIRLVAFDTWNQAIEYSQEKKEQKRNPVFQPKPGDLVGCGTEIRKIMRLEETSEIFVEYVLMDPNNIDDNCIRVDCGKLPTISEWQAWAKNSDFIRRRKK